MFGVNHLGHFAFTMALLDCLTSSQARIVNVASDAHYQAKGIDFDRLRRPARGITGMAEYSVSKLCNVLFTQELARRLAGTGVTSYALHPGVVASDIWRRVPWPVRPLVTRRMLTVEQGAQTRCTARPRPGWRRRQRPVLRQLRRAGAEPGRHRRAWRAIVAAQRGMGSR